MKVKTLVVVLGVFALALVGCAVTGPAPGAVVTDDGLIQFTAAGQSAIANDEAISMIEARAAAAAVAKANLLEKVKGAYVSGSVTVGDLMFSSQEARVSTEGFLSRATITYEEVSGVPAPNIVTAIATLTLSEDDMADLAAYVQ